MSLATSPRESLTDGQSRLNGGASPANGRPALGRNGHAPRKTRTLWPWVVGFVLLLTAGTAGAVYALALRGNDVDSGGLTFEVAQGPMVVSVTESGTVKAAEQEIIKSEIEGQSTLIYLIPEGQRVQKGELLVELDASAMADEQIDNEIAVQNADAAFIRAQEELAVVENQAKADVAQARLDYRFAQEDLTKYREGEYPKLLKEAQNKIKIAEEEFARAEEKFNGSDRLFQQKFISETELKADALAKNKAQLNLDLSRQELQLLEKWTYARQIAQLESDVEQKMLALERAERKASASVVQAQADLRAKQSEMDRQKGKLERTIAQIAKAKVYAPREGLVVYATSGREGGFRGNQEPLQEGQTVRERQELIYLPTATQMVAETKIHESSLEKVRLGMPVRITVDALPGKSFRGEVTKIAPLPDAQSMWMNPDLKVYNTQVKINGGADELRTGMSCRAEIIVENYDDATYVPVQSIVRVSGVPTAFVVHNDGRVEQRKVEIGQDNNRSVVIKSGLKRGERVLLAPPLGDTGTVETLRPEELSAEEKQKAQDAKDNPGVTPAQLPEGGPGMAGSPGGMPGDGAGMQRGGQGMSGGMPDQATMDKLRKAQQELQAKMTDEEKAKFAELRQNGDMQGMMQYGQEMANKYGIEMPRFGGMGGGGGGRGGERGGRRGGGEGDESGNRGDRDGREREPQRGSSGGSSNDPAPPKQEPAK